MKQAALSLATAIGALLALTPAALAQGETTLTYSGDPMAGSSITVTAAPGTANNLSEGFPINQGASIAIQDTAGLIESPDTPYCNQISSTQVNCRSQGLQRVSTNTGDLKDLLISRWGDVGWVHVYALGTGNDTFVGRFKPADILTIAVGQIFLGQGADTAHISGPANASGQGGRDKLIGRRGNQRFSGGPRSDRISCGKGRKDRANGGGGTDQIADNCERIVNP